jgi:hypothetical protein
MARLGWFFERVRRVSASHVSLLRFSSEQAESPILVPMRNTRFHRRPSERDRGSAGTYQFQRDQNAIGERKRSSNTEYTRKRKIAEDRSRVGTKEAQPRRNGSPIPFSHQGCSAFMRLPFSPFHTTTSRSLVHEPGGED